MKIALAHPVVLDKLKKDKDFLGAVYVDFPNEYMKIDVDDIPKEATTLYLNCYSYYFSFFWLNYEKFKNLKIHLIEVVDEEVFIYPYKQPDDKNILWEKLKTIKNRAVKNVSFEGSSPYLDQIKSFLKESGVDVVDSKGEFTIHSKNAYIFNRNIQNIIKNLTYLNKKELIYFLINSFEITKVNPFLVIVFFIYKNLPQKYNKSVAFFAPTNAYRNNLVSYKIIDKLKEKVNLYLFYGTKTGDWFEQTPYSYFLPASLHSYMDFLDIIIHPQLNILLPKKPKKFYVLHDIYDSPSGKAEKPIKDKEGNIKPSKFLNMIDYIFIPSKKVFEKKTEIKYKYLKIPGGYIKLDHNIQKFKELSKEVNVDSIVFAPTVVNEVFEELSAQSNKGIEIIETLLENFKDYNIIFRPHPNSLKHHSTKEIVEKFKSNKRFIFDDTSDYMKSYARSKLMISDFSGTAFTYAFTTSRPVIFFSVNEKKLSEMFSNISYFKDRYLIGDVAKNEKELVEKVNNILKQYNIITAKIDKFRRVTVYNIGTSEKYFVKCIETILENKKLPEWKRD